jgi:hypothetical protein
MTQSRDDTDAGGSGEVRVDAAVRVYPDTPQEVYGFVIEDFGAMSGHAVDIGEHHIVDAARRWAVRLADGSLLFVDDGDVVSID